MICETAKRSLLLAAGSAAASVCNFLVYIFIPAYGKLPSLDEFVRHNYLGGLYLFGVASSVAPIGVYVLAGGRGEALRRYCVLSGAVLLIVAFAGRGIASAPWSYLCVAAAVCLHCAGFLQAALIQRDRIVAAALLPVVQPLVFMTLISLEEIGHSLVGPWALYYFVSACFSAVLFAAATDWAWLLGLLRARSVRSSEWRVVGLRMLLAASFPLFFQFELILFGRFVSTGLGSYAMWQKLYSSVSVSLFGAVGVLLLSRSVQEVDGAAKLVDRSVLVLSLAAAACVVPVGWLVGLTGKGVDFTPALVAICGAVAFLFTASSLASLRLLAFQPVELLRVSGAAAVSYALIVSAVRPSSAAAFLWCAAAFFCVFLLATVALQVTHGRTGGCRSEITMHVLW